MLHTTYTAGVYVGYCGSSALLCLLDKLKIIRGHVSMPVLRRIIKCLQGSTTAEREF